MATEHEPPGDARSEHERMLSGDFYNSRDPELLDVAHRARRLLMRFNTRPSTDAPGRRALLEALLHEVGPGVWVEPPFFCDYGAHVSIGAQTFINARCVLLDAAAIRIGAFGLLGPGVQLLTVSHPLPAAERVVEDARPGSDRAPYRTHAAPISVGRRVWIGAGTLVMPGVTIGDDTTIGAGSLVTEDVPPGVLAFGQPCRVRRAL